MVQKINVKFFENVSVLRSPQIKESGSWTDIHLSVYLEPVVCAHQFNKLWFVCILVWAQLKRFLNFFNN